MKTKNKWLLGCCAALIISSACAVGVSKNISVSASASPVSADMSFKEGASVRIDQGSQGIRFTAYYSESIYSLVANGTGEAGMIIVPSQALEGVSDAYFDYLEDTYGKNKEEVSTSFDVERMEKQSNGTYEAKGAIINIKDENLSYTYQAVAYYYDATNGYVYSEKSDTRTISYVANKALNNTELSIETKENVLKMASDLSARLNTLGKLETSELLMETDVKAGFDVSNYVANSSIASATLDGTSLTVTDNKIELENTHADSDLKKLVLTYENDTELTFYARIWSLIIDNEEELTEMSSYEVKTYTGQNVTNTNGYFKLNADITMTQNWDCGKSLGRTSSYTNYGFQGVFDGFNHTISNLVITNGGDNGFIHTLAPTGVIRNVKIEGSTAIGGGNRGGYLIAVAYGGTVENVEITATMTASGYNATTTGGIGNGLVLGTLRYSNYMGNVTLKNVTIIAGDTATSQKTGQSALWFVEKHQSVTAETIKEKLTLENVTIVGFTNLLNHDGTLYTTVDGLSACATCTNVVAMSANDYLDSITIKKTIETDVKDGLDVTKYIGKDETISSITLNGSTVSHTNGIISYTKEDASMEEKVYTVTTDKNIYSLKTTVWSLIIDDETELLSANQYDVGSAWEAIYGYYKLNADISMTQEWQKANAIGSIGGTYGTYGFQGVFDGNNHTISNFTVKNEAGGGMFKNITKNAVVKNLTLQGVCSVAGGNSGGYLCAYICGGTLENVEIEVSLVKVANSTWGCAATFGRFGGGSASGLSEVTLKNVTVINKGETDLGYSAGLFENTHYVGTYESLTLDTVTLVGFTGLIKDGTQETAMIQTKDALAALNGISCTNVNVYTTEEFASIKAN